MVRGEICFRQILTIKPQTKSQQKPLSKDVDVYAFEGLLGVFLRTMDLDVHNFKLG